MAVNTNLPGVQAVVNIVIEQGATYSQLYTWKTNGVTNDLTGYTARAQIRTTVESATTLHSMTDGAGITLGGTAGTILITISAIDTAAFTFTKAVWDIELVIGVVVTRLLGGSVKLDKEVTK